MSDLRVEWLGMLAKMVTPADPAKGFAAMRAYLPFLAELPDAAFTSASLEHVAMSPRRLHIPDLSEVKGPLQAHWRDNRPARTALPAPVAKPEPELVPPSAEVRALVARQLAELRNALGGTRREAKPQPLKPNYAQPVELAQARAALAARAKAAQA